jgi:hypothetical protein
LPSTAKVLACRLAPELPVVAELPLSAAGDGASCLESFQQACSLGLVRLLGCGLTAQIDLAAHLVEFHAHLQQRLAVFLVARVHHGHIGCLQAVGQNAHSHTLLAQMAKASTPAWVGTK